ncbi:hypothetical protein [Variovorax sp. IB41]|uniref:hypothetical protein n=1 Tax=Variovorax sp. IB41 TaxID=2779370 RepID=UPI0018E70BA7|nr:hypothetical protein [Variovorax sp. IB41]MBJ2155261.1 hypothetical protein [Variovorax sp. IB41]
MKSLSALAIAALSAGGLSVVQLVHMDFPGVPVALNSSNVDIDFGGVTYRGAAGLGAIGAITDSPGEIKGLQLGLSGVPTEYMALALDDTNIVQGTPLTIRLAILSADWQVLDAPIDWAGRLDVMGIEEDGATCSISVSAESTAVDLLRGTPLTYSNVDQWSLYPGDRAFEYVISQANKPVTWAGKQWLIALGGR